MPLASILLFGLWTGTTVGDVAAQNEIIGTATHYGPSYDGSRMGCGGTYRTYDETIVAVSPARYAEWPCGAQLLITGPAGSILATRSDSCPGCSANMVDLSERGNEIVCGAPAHTCSVAIKPID